MKNDDMEMFKDNLHKQEITFIFSFFYFQKTRLEQIEKS